MSNLSQDIQSLKTLVKSENTELRQGIYTQLKETLSEKGRLTQRLESQLKGISANLQTSSIASELERLHVLLKENDYLMRSAINSVKLAHKQLSVIRNTEKKVGAYNRYGRTVYLEDLPGLRNKLV